MSITQAMSTTSALSMKQAILGVVETLKESTIELFIVAI
jgi:hypothetical protein